MNGFFQIFKCYISGLSAFLLAFLITLILTRINRSFAGNLDQITAITYVLFAIIVFLPGAVYLVIKRKAINPWKLSKLFLSSLIIVFVGLYLFTVKDQINFRGDFLIWSESDYVNDILKFRAGHPLYTDQLNNESFL